MKDPETLISELSYCDATTNIFSECIIVNKPFDKKILGVYAQRLEACNIKLRFAANSLIKLRNILKQLEYGEFIYFDDKDRLNATFYLESLLVFLRASLDLTISAYCIYFTSKTNMNSFNDFLKKIKSGLDWLPNSNKEYWETVYNDYISEDFTWIQSLVGRDKGMSLRDLVVHKSIVELDTIIDDKDKGRFYVKLSSDSYTYAIPWIELLYFSVIRTVEIIKNDIKEAESKSK
jgi:hypothetical protein